MVNPSPHFKGHPDKEGLLRLFETSGVAFYSGIALSKPLAV